MLTGEPIVSSCYTCVSPLQIGLWMCCVRIGSSVGSKAIGSDSHQGLCIALGAFRTSPTQSLYVEAYEPFLASRRLNLALNYVLKLKSLPFSLQLSFRTWKCQAMWRISVENSTSRYSTSRGKFKINRNLIDAVASLDIAPWTLSAPTVWFDPTKLKKIRQTLKLTNSFIYNLLQNIPRQKKVSLTVQKHWKEWLLGLSPINGFILYRSASRQQLCIYCWITSYYFSSQTCLLFQRKIDFDIIWLSFVFPSEISFHQHYYKYIRVLIYLPLYNAVR